MGNGLLNLKNNDGKLEIKCADLDLFEKSRILISLITILL